MTHEEQLALQKKSGREQWNIWREKYTGKRFDLSEVNLRGANLSGQDLRHKDLTGADLSREADLSGADLRGADLSGADLSGADIRGADFSGANLSGVNLGVTLRLAHFSGVDLSRSYLRSTDFRGADLRHVTLSGQDLSRKDFREANLRGADLQGTNFRGADLRGADFSGADLRGANLSDQDLSHIDFRGADLSGADLKGTNLSGTNFTGATLTNCTIYGIAAWNVRLENAIQKDLIITQEHEATITIDNLKVAQFIYLMLNNREIRDVLDTIAKKVVLILGRFTPERKVILNELREVLRTRDYLPILFDFQRPTSQDLTGTVSTLAHISRFIIADLTDPSCSPYEIGLIASCRKPIAPIFQPSETALDEFSMLKNLQRRNHWILPTQQYNSLENLLASLQDNVIDPAEKKVTELERE